MKQDIIDNYILGKMSDEERLAFEQEMSQDKSLQEEVALQRDIVRAIRLKAAKEHLQAVEREIQAKERRRKVFAIRLSSVAIAACLALGIFFYVDTANSYISYGLNIQHEIIVTKGASRGGESYSEQAFDAINKKDFDKALAIIEEGEKLKFTFSDPNPALQEQALLEYKMEQGDLQWYKAVAYMSKGRWIKAKRSLKEIATSDSYYKAEAKKALEELKTH
jgi:hypothetical protein